MSDFYSNKENLVGVLTHWLAIFSEGQPPIVPVIYDESGSIDLEKTMELPCYANFPASELAIWRESWVKPATIGVRYGEPGGRAANDPATA